MKLDAFEYDVPWRENWHLKASLYWGIGSAICLTGPLWSPVPTGVWAASAAVSASMCGFRFLRGRGLSVMQKGLSGRELTFTTFDELQKLANGHEGRQWLGKGFVWGTKHAQRVYELQKRTEEVVEPAKQSKDDLEPAQVGQRWIHGVETDERDIWQPLKHAEAHTLIIGTPGSGKAQPLDALVHTPKGFVQMGSLKVGDLVTTPDGLCAPITGIYPQGVQNIYEMNLEDGRRCECTMDHLWEVYFKKGDFPAGKRFYKLFELTDCSVDKSGRNTAMFEFSETKIDLEGVIPAVLTTAVLKRLIQVGLAIYVPTAGNVQVLHPMRMPMLFGQLKAMAKFVVTGLRSRQVPAQHLHLSGYQLLEEIEENADLKTREAFLEAIFGLNLDEGEPKDSVLVSQTMADCIRHFAWSVGCDIRIEKRDSKIDERVRLYLEKREQYYLHKNRAHLGTALANDIPVPSVRLSSVKFVNQRQAQCIKINHPRELYVTNDYIVTHNTRMLDLLVSQAILRGESVLIIDPKGDAELKNNAQRACRLLGRANDFVQFHLAFPEESIRIDPLRNFSNNFEIAERIRALLASGGSNDTFSNFSWLAINNLVEGMMLCYEKPTLLRLRMLLEGGIERLVIGAVQNYGKKVDPEFDSHIELYDFSGKDMRAKASLWEKYYREYVEPSWPHAGLNGLISQFNHDAEHFSKMVASLQPIMQMLTSGSLADILSPTDDNDDMRPLLDMKRIVNQNLVAYFGLDAMKAGQTASAIGSLILADLTSVAGSRYDYAERLGQPNTPVNIFVDEASEVVNDPFIQMLNKARGANFRIWVATQTYADFQSKLQDKAKATQVLANVNNIIAFRTLDPETQKYFCDPIPKTRLKYVMRTQGQSTDSNEPIVHGANFGERLMEEEGDLITPQLLGLLPGLEYIARISGGHVVKGRIPILVAKKGDKN